MSLMDRRFVRHLWLAEREGISESDRPPSPGPTQLLSVSRATDQRALRIVFVTGSLEDQSSGPYQSLLETTLAMSSMGHATTVVGTRKWGRPSINGWPGPAVALLRLGPYSFHFTPGLHAWLRREWPGTDLVSLQSVWQYPNWVLREWCRQKGLPYVITTHGNLSPVALSFSATKKRIAARWFADSLLRSADALHALNEAERRHIRNYGLRQPVIVVPNGVRLPEEQNIDVNCRARIRAQLGNRHCLLFVGRLHPIKGLGEFLRAVARVRCGPEWALVLAGPEERGYRAELRHRVCELGIDDSVLFPGPIYGEEKRAWLEAADLFVLPSKSEGFPMAALEALAHRVPVLLTRACNFPDAAACGAGVETGNSLDEFASALRAMTASAPDTRRAMGERGRRLVERDYTWESVARKLTLAFAWILGRAERPDFVRTD